MPGPAWACDRWGADMSRYEQRCRVLLKAFPHEYRSQRGD